MPSFLALATAAGVALLVTVGGQAASLGDPFDGNRLSNPNWKWTIQPRDWDVGKTKAGWLHVKGELNRNLWADDTTNRLYQERRGDFEIATHLFMEYKDACVVAGLVALSPTTKDHQGRASEWVTIKLWGRGPANGNNAVIQYQKREFDGGEGLTGQVPGFLDPVGPMNVHFRLRRAGDTFTGWWKRKGGDQWVQLGETQQKFDEPLQVGLYVGICDAVGQQAAQFEYFEDMREPFSVSARDKLSVAWAGLKRVSD
jgi:hypothetical protein